MKQWAPMMWLLVVASAGAQPVPSPAGVSRRLALEQSPYLVQHADDPVDWHPWGDEAFALAKKLDRPVFLSSGYAACHWCHVMQRECFQDPEVAAFMNAHFVSVKLDREERPDVDRVYLEACQSMGQRGGWPLSAFLMADRQPFWIGTYVPRDAFLEMCKSVHAAWQDEDGRARISEFAARVVKGLAEQHKGAADGSLPGEDLLPSALEQILDTEDPDHGGFASAPTFAPKFPVPSVPRFVLREAARAERPESAAAVRRLLDALLAGGIRDHLAGGFHRYSTDREWKVPHFEKMLYDQALLSQLFLEGWQVFGEQRYADAVIETLDWCLRDLKTKDGGFIAALDADADHKEGATYVFSLSALRDALTPAEFAAVESWCGAHEDGNWREESAPDEPTHSNILFEARPLPAVAAECGQPLEVVRGHLQSARKKLLAARSSHPQPRQDTKVLTGWNGFMVSALARAGAALDRPDWVTQAATTMELLHTRLRDEKGRYLRSLAQNQARHPGELADHGALLLAALDLHEATLDRRWLARAEEIAAVMERVFGEEDGGFVDSPESDLPFQTRTAFDGAYPSGFALAVTGLARLGVATAAPHHTERARRALSTRGHALERSPNGSTQSLMALDWVWRGGVKVEVHGAADHMVAFLRKEFRPFVVLTRAEATAENQLEKPGVVVCSGTTCLAPAHTEADVRQRIAEALAFR